MKMVVSVRYWLDGYGSPGEQFVAIDYVFATDDNKLDFRIGGASEMTVPVVESIGRLALNRA